MSRIHQFNTSVKTDIERKMENSKEPIHRYTALADKAIWDGHTYEEVIAELEAEKTRVLSAPVDPFIQKIKAAQVRSTKLACVQAIDTLIKDLKERHLPKEN